MKIIWLILLISFTGCGPGFYLRKAERALKKAEQLGATTTSDTVFILKEVIVPETHFDTVLRVVNFHDTITVEKDRIVTRVKINTVTKEIFVSTKCPEDTVKIKVPVNVYRTIQARGWLRWWHILIAFIVGVVLGRLVLKLLI